jgi:hypothetical protein
MSVLFANRSSNTKSFTLSSGAIYTVFPGKGVAVDCATDKDRFLLTNYQGGTSCLMLYLGSFPCNFSNPYGYFWGLPHKNNLYYEGNSGFTFSNAFVLRSNIVRNVINTDNSVSDVLPDNSSINSYLFNNKNNSSYFITTFSNVSRYTSSMTKDEYATLLATCSAASVPSKTIRLFGNTGLVLKDYLNQTVDFFDIPPGGITSLVFYKESAELIRVIQDNMLLYRITGKSTYGTSYF